MVENAAQRGQRHLRESGYTTHKGGDIHTDAKADAAMVAKGVHEHEANMHKGWPKTKLKLKGGGKVPGHKGEARPDRRARGGSITADQPDDAQGNVGANSARARGGRTRRADGGGMNDDERQKQVTRDVGAMYEGRVQRYRDKGLDSFPVKDDTESRARGGHVGKKGRTTVNINLGHGDQGNPAREQAAHQEGIKKGLMLGAAVHPPGPGALPTAPGGMPPHPPMGLPTGGPPGMGAPPMGGAPMMPPRPPMAGPPMGAPPGGMPPMMHKRGGAVRRADGGATSDDDRMLTPKNRDIRASGNADMDAMAIMGGRGKAVGEMHDEAERRNYAPRKRGGHIERRDAEGRFTGGSI